MGMLGKLRSVTGCDFVRSKLYQKYVLGLERLEAINVFGEGLNVLGLFQRLDAQNMSDELLISYLTRSGRPTSSLMESLMDVSLDNVVPEELPNAKMVEEIFRTWLCSPLANDQKMQFLHREITGSNWSCGQRWTLHFFSNREGYMSFNTCTRELSLNTIIHTEMENEDWKAEDEADFFDLLLKEEIRHSGSAQSAFSEV